MNKYFKVLDSDTNFDKKTGLNSGYSVEIPGNIIFMDGSSIGYDGLDSKDYGIIPLDINGNAKPNVYGRDYFEIKVDQKGFIQDADDCETWGGSYIDGYTYTVGIVASCGLCEEKLKNNPNYEGCYLYRIRKDGWQMKY